MKHYRLLIGSPILIVKNIYKMVCSLCKKEGHRCNNKKFHPVEKIIKLNNNETENDINLRNVKTVEMDNIHNTIGNTDDIHDIDIGMEKLKLDIACPEGVIDGYLYTKEKRHELHGVVAGGKGSKSPEDYQRKQIVLGTSRPCYPTPTRINWRTNELIDISQPMRKRNGFDYTENFDGKQIFSLNTVWINLKSVVGTGGSQTRTLRNECYPFVNYQLCYLIKTKKTDCYFANIFDGDESFSKMKMFQYLLDLPEFSSIKNYVYVGDLKGYFPWIKANVF